MEKIFKNLKADSGEIVLFVVFVILFFMLFIGLFLSQMILREIKMANNTADSVQSYYAADSGSEITLYRLSQGDPELVSPASYPSQPSNTGYPIGETTDGRDYQVTLKSDTTSGTPKLIINILGTYKQTSRAIELSWDNI